MHSRRMQRLSRKLQPGKVGVSWSFLENAENVGVLGTSNSAHHNPNNECDRWRKTRAYIGGSLGDCDCECDFGIVKVLQSMTIRMRIEYS